MFWGRGRPLVFRPAHVPPRSCYDARRALSLVFPRPIPLRTRTLVFLEFLWIPFFWLAVSLPWAALDYAESGLLAAFRDCVDLPAQVVRTRPVSESHGKGSRLHGHRV